jgi:hypothetical protein
MIEQVENFLNQFKLELKEKYPSHLIHLYVDYIELIALFTNEDHITIDEVLNRFSDSGLIKKSADDASRAQSNDNNEAFIKSLFSEIENRKVLFSDAYPFEYNFRSGLILKTELSNKQKLYVFLLLSSSLNIFSPFKEVLTSEFETVCFNSLSNYLPSNTILKQFGENSEYKGNIIEKIDALAKDINIEVDTTFLSKISQRGNKERGLDIIGWLPFTDGIPNLFSILGQCTCQKDWQKKVGESRRYNRYLKFYLQLPLHAMFVPYSLTDYQSGDFYQSDEFGENTIIFERNRILSCSGEAEFINSLNSIQLIESCIVFEEDIV